jgi:hypothetical protein
MTFKHGKLDDSATMRSLIKVAHEKGLIKDEPVLTKTASLQKKADYSPSSNLMENIIKLCTGLRGMGLDKFANDLESKFMEYKRANSLYETSKETGDDVVDQAHPQGSHKISDVEGDAVVETILDQHLKMVNVVNKKPTGKLASNLDILNAVKKVVAQKLSINDYLQKMKVSAKAVNQGFHSASLLTRPMTFVTGELLDAVDALNKDNINFEILNNIYLLITNTRKELSPKLGGLTGIEEDKWRFIEPHLNEIQNGVYQIQELLKNPSKTEAPVVNPIIDSFNKKLDGALSVLMSWANIVQTDTSSNEEEKAAGMKWINDKKVGIMNLKTRFEALDDASKLEVYTGQLRRLNEITAEFAEFKKNWID